MHLLYLGNALSKYGFTPTTVETLGERFSEDFKLTIASSTKNKILRLLDMWFHLLWLRKKVDIVLIDTYSSSAFLFAWTSARVCELLKIKYIAYLHGGDLPRRFSHSPSISSRYLKNAFKIVAPSGFLRKAVVDNFKLPVFVIPNYLDLHLYPFTPRTEIREIKLLWVRSFHQIYQPQLAIEIVSLLKKKSLPVHLTMIGPDKDGSLQKCKDLVRKLNLESNVVFTGRLTKQEWIGLSKEHNIFLNTTSVDNTPVSVMEAMALGMPVLTTKVGGIPFLFEDEHEGIMISEHTENAFVDSITELMHSSQKTNHISDSARRKAETWDWLVIRDQWNEILTTI